MRNARKTVRLKANAGDCEVSGRVDVEDLPEVEDLMAGSDMMPLEVEDDLADPCGED